MNCLAAENQLLVLVNTVVSKFQLSPRLKDNEDVNAEIKYECNDDLPAIEDKSSEDEIQDVLVTRRLRRVSARKRNYCETNDKVPPKNGNSDDSCEDSDNCTLATIKKKFHENRSVFETEDSKNTLTKKGNKRTRISDESKSHSNQISNNNLKKISIKTEAENSSKACEDPSATEDVNHTQSSRVGCVWTMDAIKEAVELNLQSGKLVASDLSTVTIRVRTWVSRGYRDPDNNVTSSAGVKQCPLCDEAYENNELLLQHIQSAHVNHIVCHVCYTVLKKKVPYRRHMRAHLRPYQCKICNTINTCFAKQESYGMHMSRCHRRQHICNQCGNCYGYIRSLRSHMLRVHNIADSDTPERVLICDKCKTVFSREYSYKMHDCEKRLSYIICDICGKSVTRDYYSTHKKVHAGEKNFKCGVCDKMFVTNNQMKNHMMRHSGEKRYVCDVCGNAYTQSHTLVIHKRLHTGERPYKCELCGGGFVSSDTLRLHRKSKHKILK